MNPKNKSQKISQLLSDAVADGLSQKSSEILIENLSPTTVAGAQGTPVDDLSGDQVSLVCLVVDKTGSMEPHQSAVIDSYNRLLTELKSCKVADSILVSTILFEEKSTLLHSFLPVKTVPPLSTREYRPDGYTALFDAVLDSFTALVAYGQELRNNGVFARIVVVAITDGEDNSSRHAAAEVKTVADSLLRQEVYTLALVGFGHGFAQYTAQNMGFPNVLESSADGASIRHAMGIVSSSILRASQTQVNSTQPNSFFN